MPESSPHQSPRPQPSKSAQPPGAPGTGKRFADTFRRRRRAPRGLTPGSRVWAVTGWTVVTTATVVTVLMTVPPLLADHDDDKQETGQTVVAAPEPVTPSPSPSPKASKKTASPSPSKKETEREEPAPVVVTTTVKAAPVTKEPAAKQTKKAKKAKKAPSTPQWTQTVIAATNILSTGESWKTNRIRMVMQGDGNLVVYDENNKATWASMVFGEGHTARFQTDGNLCVYNGDDKPVWATGTFGHPGAKLVLRKDGKVAIVDGATVLWST